MSHQYQKNQGAVNLLVKSWKPENLQHSTVDAKCTPGVGDFMYVLNTAYLRSFVLDRPVILNLHWYHTRDFLYHFEDPETIVERFEYVHNFYLKYGAKVKAHHIFDSNDLELYYKRHRYYERGSEKLLSERRFPRVKYNDWEFRKTGLETIPGKILIWTQVHNAEQPRLFKRPFTLEQWNHVKEIIELQGYHTVEVDYRTPISEVFYHAATCECTVSYEGMWHYVAKNFHKPMIVLTQDNITKLHTPNALIYQVRKVDQHSFRYFHNFDRRLQRAKEIHQEFLVQWRKILSYESR